jgi:hypothetical protein
MLPSVCSRALHEVEGESWEERHLLEGANEVMFWYKPARCSFFCSCLPRSIHHHQEEAISP